MLLQFRFISLCLFSLACVLIAIPAQLQFLVPNGFYLLLALIFMLDKHQNIWLLFVVAGCHDIFTNSIFGVNFIIYLIVSYFYNHASQFIQKQDWILRWSIFNVIILIMVYPSVDIVSYLNLWGWPKMLVNLSLNFICSALFWQLLADFKAEATIGFYRIKTLCRS